MKAFWWFKHNVVAGMARPGFNSTHFYELTFDEMTLLGWLGQHSCGHVTLEEFRSHCETYMPRIFSLIKMEPGEGNRLMAPLLQADGFARALDQLNKKTSFFKSFEFKGDELNFKLNLDHLHREIEFLKTNQISSIIALTEKHHHRDLLAPHFDVHHVSIPDMHPPTLQQVEEVAKIFDEARSNKKKVAIHCLAGIGRTSTMIIAAHKLLGEDLDSLIEEVKLRNPSYKFSGPQAAFLESLR